VAKVSIFALPGAEEDKIFEPPDSHCGAWKAINRRVVAGRTAQMWRRSRPVKVNKRFKLPIPV
jgi:hypothetical protein